MAEIGKPEANTRKVAGIEITKASQKHIDSLGIVLIRILPDNVLLNIYELMNGPVSLQPLIMLYLMTPAVRKREFFNEAFRRGLLESKLPKK